MRHNTDSNGHILEFSKTGASASTRNELMSKFFTQAEKDRRDAERAAFLNGEARRTSSGATAASALTPHGRGHSISGPVGQPISPLREIHPRNEQFDSSSFYSSGPLQARPAQHDHPVSASGNSPPNPQSYAHSPPVPSTALQPPPAKEKEVDSPYKAEMVARMDTLKRGERILPPCDRCRRLHMDCVKNLTACQGCTKKHAKCSWRDVRQSEVFGPNTDKIPIPVAEVEREREPSVGFRPEERDNVSPHSTTPSSSVFAGNEGSRAVATEGRTPDPMSHHPYSSGTQPTRYDSSQIVSPRTDHYAEESLSHVERAAATAAAAVSHSDVFGERRDGHPPMVM
jgi:hypothetical protein